MRLSQLIAETEARMPAGAGDPEVSSVVCDSREVVPGSLFVCLSGGSRDGHDFAAAAVEAGAVAILAERQVPVRGAPLLLAPSTRRLLPTLALRIEGDPHRALRLVGITGTNGKTTVAFLLASILAAAGKRPGVIGTVGVFAQGRRVEGAGLTTPGAVELARTLRRLVDLGCDSLVMEVSSHALEQERVLGLAYDACAFTNLSRDHLDYHGDMESYFHAKERLFIERMAEGGRAVIHAGDPWGRRLLARLPGALGFSSREPADVHATEVRTSLRGIAARVSVPGGVLRLRSPLIGGFNLENLLCAAGLAHAMGIPIPSIEEGLASSAGAPGRLERVERGGVTAFIDYAHTDDALRRAIAAIREVGPRRILVVFGCGGDRDRGKRPLMAEAASAADFVVVTSDNPRTEAPEAIVAEILPGLRREEGEFSVELDRGRAIRLAMELAEQGDAVLIAGKGHEDHQLVGDEKRPFDDREEARRALEARFP